MSSMELPELDQVVLQEEKELFNSSKALFNSKLFINLDITDQDNYLNNENIIEEGMDNTAEFEEINYLSNELIKDLDVLSSISNEKEKELNIDTKNNKNIINNNIILDSLLSLAKDGYEFKPKNYKPYQSNSNRYIKQTYNKNVYYNNKKKKKNDWFCSYCNNLNFSFRNKCNKCKVSKESSKKHKNYYINRVI